MPELPDIVVYVDALEKRILGERLERIRIASPFLLRTAAPPVGDAEGTTVAQLRQLIETTLADIAILDVNLKGEKVFPAAELLIRRGVPIVFTTGYAPEKIFPPHLLGLPVLWLVRRQYGASVSIEESQSE